MNSNLYSLPEKLDYKTACERLQELDHIEQYRDLSEDEKAEFYELIMFTNEVEKISM